MKHLFFCLSLLVVLPSVAQTDTLVSPVDTTAEEDYSAYDNLVPEESAVSPWASAKIFDLSPQKLISIGYDVQGPHHIHMVWTKQGPDSGQTGHYGVKASHGLRLGFNIPVISKNRLTWTMAGNYLENRYVWKGEPQLGVVRPTDAFSHSLGRGIRSAGLATTVFVPFSATRFLLVQAQADMNGDYGWNDFTDYVGKTKISGAAIYGKRPHDRLQWGLGITRTYRAGEVNLLPIFFYNYTFPSRKGGIEMLFPARVAIRRTFNSRSILLVGYELEGQSYALRQQQSVLDFPYFGVRNAELRRSEIRARVTYERSLSGFIWLSVQAGYRINYSFNVDDGEFFRGFFGDQPFVMQNKLGGAPYALFSINLVSP